MSRHQHTATATSEHSARERNSTGDKRAGGYCRNCDAWVDPNVARVVGDNDGAVPVCTNCYENRNSGNPPTTVAAVNLYRRDKRKIRGLGGGTR
ncbi:hypothetical protein D3D02_17095 [Halobellus sp. Atlit-38R]|uniref:DUF7563 family protein n=1 Tax=Halobellus sp. Atlit-38R TaxID=2282131 RepID=UPI000EF24BEC|nr:hypothetical protein [Halobellus sp. Atlit-38R]RLM83719.1 hypothetical protein D3D02_17095 [Halobellus sp. Atlit-38R]